MNDMPMFPDGGRILFQGDSITDGNRGRVGDPSHMLGQSYAFIIAARYGAALAERRLTFFNRGISGNTVPDLKVRWRKDTLELRPDLLSVLIGVNDLGRGLPLGQFEPVYDQLLADARAANPNLRLVLCEPFIANVGGSNGAWAMWHEEMTRRQGIVGQLAAKYGAALVRFQKMFDDATQRAPAEYWIWDGVHPTHSGHELMADEWVRTVKEFWPGDGK
jgi:lysophospholipase L1-like esterase